MAGDVVHGQTNAVGTLHVYEISAEDSDIRLLIYRTGAMARLGHNHVISVGELQGTVYVHSNLAESSMEIEISVDQLIVDDLALRQEEGEEFSGDPSESDINGTRDNMLGEQILHAEEYPSIRITSGGPIGAEEEATINLSIRLLGRVVELSVPVSLQIAEDELQASGEFRLSHEQLGMKPFSVMMGAIQVANEMDLKYRIRAQRVPN
jgi:hypothetical protein